jgi:hypothetical protein
MLFNCRMTWAIFLFTSLLNLGTPQMFQTLSTLLPAAYITL